MLNGIICLMAARVSLNSIDRDTLYQKACTMFAESRNKEKVKTETMEGVIKSDFSSMATLGAFSGVRFVAEVETNLGKGRVVFLVQDFDLKAARDGLDWSPVAEGLDTSRLN